MTMIAWLGCDEFALLASDQLGVATSNAVITLGDLNVHIGPGTRVQGFPKIRAGATGTDLFAGCGNAGFHQRYLDEVASLTGYEADATVQRRLAEIGDIRRAHLLPAGEHETNTCVHTHFLEGRSVCSVLTASPMHHVYVVHRGGTKTISSVYEGSGSLYANHLRAFPAQQEEWKQVETRTDDWRASFGFVKKMFRAVSSVDPLVGKTVEVWLGTPAKPKWEKVLTEEA